MPLTGFGCPLLVNQTCSLLCKQTQRAGLLTSQARTPCAVKWRLPAEGVAEWGWGRVVDSGSEQEAGRAPGAQCKLARIRPEALLVCHAEFPFAV